MLITISDLPNTSIVII